jgi:hypothetical protein
MTSPNAIASINSRALMVLLSLDSANDAGEDARAGRIATYRAARDKLTTRADAWCGRAVLDKAEVSGKLGTFFAVHDDSPL